MVEEADYRVTGELRIKRIDAAAPAWPEELDRLRAALGAPNNPSLFPAHFLKATFPKIGGITLRVEDADGAILAGCFLFPRHVREGKRVYTLRYHPATAIANDLVDSLSLVRQVESLLCGEQVIFYDPAAHLTYHRTSQVVEGIDIGRPDAAEATALRTLAGDIWGADPDGLYPADIPAVEFQAGTALVARLDRAVVGFLLGFYKFGGSRLPEQWRTFDGGLRLESQLLGVNPRARQHGLGTLLKRVQGQQAAAAGIDIVNWTVDPLQFGNAVLNFGRLRAIAFDFLPDYYPFRNALNRVPASRLGMTWLVRSARVRGSLAETKSAGVRDLTALSHVRRLNDGLGAPNFDADDPVIAIEIPAHWTELQRDDLARAHAWRTTTDQLFRRYLGPRLGDYLLTGVAVDGERRYLVGQRIDAGLLARYGQPAVSTANHGEKVHAN